MPPYTGARESDIGGTTIKRKQSGYKPSANRNRRITGAA
jgi:hypothetical protein